MSKTNSLDENYRYNSISNNICSSGALFVSVRLGLEKLEKEYYNQVLKLFQIPGNIGLIGGEKNKGFYYFGATNENELLFLDPHLNQKSFKSRTELENFYLTSYIPNYFYKINIENISPAFTVGFLFHNINEFKLLMFSLKNYAKNNNFSVFNFSKTKNETNKDGKDLNNNVNSNNKEENNKGKSFYSYEVEGDFEVIDLEK